MANVEASLVLSEVKGKLVVAEIAVVEVVYMGMAMGNALKRVRLHASKDHSG